jgi:hypothetical protein
MNSLAAWKHVAHIQHSIGKRNKKRISAEMGTEAD